MRRHCARFGARWPGVFAALVGLYVGHVAVCILSEPLAPRRPLDLAIGGGLSSLYVGAGAYILVVARTRRGRVSAICWSTLNLVGVVLSLALTGSGLGRRSWQLIFAYDAVVLFWTIVTVAVLFMAVWTSADAERLGSRGAGVSADGHALASRGPERSNTDLD